MRVVFAGTPEAAVPSLRAIHESDHEIAAVVTRPPAPKGRGRELAASPIASVAQALGLPVLAPANLRDPEFVAQITELEPHCCPVVAFGALIPPVLLRLPARGWLNLHFSLLPSWRGAAPVQHSILHGDDITGATTFLLDEGMDTGPVLGQVTEPIHLDDTAADVLGRLARSGAGLLVHTLDAVADGSAHAEPQPTDGVTYAPKLTVDDARVNWDVSAVSINRLIRACEPAPGAWTTHGQSRVKLLGSEVVQAADLNPGQVRVDKNAVVVGCGTSALRLVDVQPQGKRVMSAGDWVRGLRDVSGLAFL